MTDAPSFAIEKLPPGLGSVDSFRLFQAPNLEDHKTSDNTPDVDSYNRALERYDVRKDVEIFFRYADPLEVLEWSAQLQEIGTRELDLVTERRRTKASALLGLTEIEKLDGEIQKILAMPESDRPGGPHGFFGDNYRPRETVVATIKWNRLVLGAALHHLDGFPFRGKTPKEVSEIADVRIQSGILDMLRWSTSVALSILHKQNPDEKSLLV